MEEKWRLILDHERDGYYNMAVDEAILVGYSEIKVPTLRVYGWDKPFVTLGYNQDPDKVLTQQLQTSFTRRITGGSAILHDKELTYSITCSVDDLNLTQSVKRSYERICSFLKYFYSRLGLGVRFAKDVFPDLKYSYGNFCFSSFQPFDILIGKKKIGGNAQYRKKSIIFQHGSIPIEIDFIQAKRIIKNTEESTDRAISLNQALGRSVDTKDLQCILVKSFENNFRVKMLSGKLSAFELKILDCLMEKKYKLDNWKLYRESIKF